MTERELSWGPLEVGVLGLLTDLDPYGLTPGVVGGAPADEYDIEARPMASLLRDEGVITADQMDAISLNWFGAPLTGVVGTDRVYGLVVQLNDLAFPRDR